MSDSNKFSLIDVEGISNVANNLIDKLSNAVGWIVNRETPNKIAISTYIEDIKTSNYDPLLKAALISQSKKTLKEYCNQRDIIGIALNAVQDNAKPELVEDDWILQFMDRARLVSDETFQFIWGKILATECDNPQTVPRALLSILSQMDKEDAETFTTLCSMSVRVSNEYAPLITQDRLDEYKQFGITYDKLVSLRALGLIEMDFGGIATGYNLPSEDEVATAHYFDNEYIYPREKESVDIGNVIYTKSGQALHRAIVSKKIEGFWEEFCLPWLESYEESWDEKPCKESKNEKIIMNLI